MNEILDEIEPKNRSNRYSKISLVSSLISVSSSLYLFLSVPKTIKAIDTIKGTYDPHPIFIISIQVFCIVGIFATVLSFMKKEKPTWIKWIGAFLNILVFAIIVVSTIYTEVIN